MINKKISSLITFLIVLPLSSAVPYYFEDILEESWIVFAMIFVILFAVIHFSLGKSVFKGNTAISAVIALCVAFLAIIGLSKEGFIGLSIINAVIIVCVIVIFIFFVFIFGRAAHAHFGKAGVLLILSVLFIAFYLLPDLSQKSYIFPNWFFEWASLFLLAGIILGIISIILFIKNK